VLLNKFKCFFSWGLGVESYHYVLIPPPLCIVKRLKCFRLDLSVCLVVVVIGHTDNNFKKTKKSYTIIEYSSMRYVELVVVVFVVVVGNKNDVW